MFYYSEIFSCIIHIKTEDIRLLFNTFFLHLWQLNSIHFSQDARSIKLLSKKRNNTISFIVCTFLYKVWSLLLCTKANINSPMKDILQQQKGMGIPLLSFRVDYIILSTICWCFSLLMTRKLHASVRRCKVYKISINDKKRHHNLEHLSIFIHTLKSTFVY